MKRIAELSSTKIEIDAGASLGASDLRRHGLSLGGINALPLPDRVIDGTRRLQPRRIRIFIQEFFRIYPAHGRFDWSRLDPYMESLAKTGAKIAAAVTIKPKPLFPAVDASVWKPNDLREWQAVLFELVRRYSVEKPYVTHWEIANETDIGENGGSPYLIPDPEDYFEFYRTAVAPILRAAPAVKVGGPASCWIENEPLPGLARRCAETGTRLDFLSWHHYGSDPARHADGARKAKALLEPLGLHPELFVTEWSAAFDPVSVEELAADPRRSALTAAAILAMHDAGVDETFYYHLWDQTCYADDFRPFFTEKGAEGMLRHWNEIPHRFGLFGVGGEARPQYFVYDLLSRVGGERVAVEAEVPSLRVFGAKGDGAVSLLVANYDPCETEDMVATLAFTALTPGPKTLSVCRVPDQIRRTDESWELPTSERRVVDVADRFECQILCPADSVSLIRLEPIG